MPRRTLEWWERRLAQEAEAAGEVDEEVAPRAWVNDEFDPARISYGERYAHREDDGGAGRR